MVCKAAQGNYRFRTRLETCRHRPRVLELDVVKAGKRMSLQTLKITHSYLGVLSFEGG